MILVVSDVDRSPNLYHLALAYPTDRELLIIAISDEIPTFILDLREKLRFSFRLVHLPHNKGLPRIRELLTFWQLLRNHRTKTLLVSGYRAQLISIPLGFFARIQNRIFIRHFMNPHHTFKRSHRFVLDLIINFASSGIIAVSESVANLLCKVEFVSRNKIHVFYNGVEVKELLNISRLPVSPALKSRVNIVMIGRHIESKGFVYGIKAFAHAYKLNNSLYLRIFGEFSHATADIMNALHDLPCNSYELVPSYASHKQIYSGASVVIHTPTSEDAESFGLVYLEAILSGAKCIFTKSGVIREIGEICYLPSVTLVDYQNWQQIFSAILKSIENHDETDSISILDVLNRFDVHRTSEHIVKYILSLDDR